MLQLYLKLKNKNKKIFRYTHGEQTYFVSEPNKCAFPTPTYCTVSKISLVLPYQYYHITLLRNVSLCLSLSKGHIQSKLFIHYCTVYIVVTVLSICFLSCESYRTGRYISKLYRPIQRSICILQSTKPFIHVPAYDSFHTARAATLRLLIQEREREIRTIHSV